MEKLDRAYKLSLNVFSCFSWNAKKGAFCTLSGDINYLKLYNYFRNIEEASRNSEVKVKYFPSGLIRSFTFLFILDTTEDKLLLVRVHAKSSVNLLPIDFLNLSLCVLAMPFSLDSQRDSGSSSRSKHKK